MNRIHRTLIAFALAALSIGAASAQQTLTFTNTDTVPGAPVTPQSVELLAGSTVSIAPNGNISAQCTLTGSLCTGTGSGTGDPAPTVSLAASAFSNSPTNGLYPVNTTFTLTPTVTNADVCVRSVSGSTPGGTNWPANVVLPFAAQVVTLSTPLSTYQFTMKCYGSGGSATFTLANVSTAQGPPPNSCTGFVSPLPSGWVRGGLTEFIAVPAIEGFGNFWNAFPDAGLTGYMVTGNTQYHSIAFTTPATAWTVPNFLFAWDQSQIGGAATLSKVYVTISSCAADFRIPTAGSTAPDNDKTFARGCRSIRAGGSIPSINYEISTLASTDSICRLAPGQSYHLNFIRADARDGAIGTPAAEAACANAQLTSCGIQMRVN